MEKLLNTRQVAETLGVTLSKFQRNVVKMRKEHGFPSPVPRMHLYDLLAIERWRRDQAGLTPAASAPVPANDDVADWQATLDARSAQIARDGGRA